MKSRLAAVALVLAAGGIVGGREWIWRLENRALPARSVSPSGRTVAQAYRLGEEGGGPDRRGPAPYGVGVYLRPRWLPLRSFGATLVFAGYCSEEPGILWQGDDELSVRARCEGPPRFVRTGDLPRVRWDAAQD